MSSFSVLSQARSMPSNKGASPKVERVGAGHRHLSAELGWCASPTPLEAGEETEIIDDKEADEDEGAPRKSASWVRAVSNWRANMHARSTSMSGSLRSVSNVSLASTEGGVDESPKAAAFPTRGRPRRGSFTERIGELAQNAKTSLNSVPKPAFLRRSASVGSLKSFTAALALKRPKAAEEEEEEDWGTSLPARRSMEHQDCSAPSTSRYPNWHRGSTTLEPCCRLLPPPSPRSPVSPLVERKRKSSLHAATLEPRRALRHDALPPLPPPAFKLELPSVPKNPHTASVDAEVLRRASALPARLIQPRVAAQAAPAPAPVPATASEVPPPLAPPPTVIPLIALPPITPPFNGTMTPSPHSSGNIMSARQLKVAEVGTRQRLLSLFRGTASAPAHAHGKAVRNTSPKSSEKTQKQHQPQPLVGVAVEKHTICKSSPGLTSSAPPVFQLRSTPPLHITKASKEVVLTPPSSNGTAIAPSAPAQLDTQGHGLLAPSLPPFAPISPLLAALEAHNQSQTSLLSLPPPVPEKDAPPSPPSSSDEEYQTAAEPGKPFPHTRSLSRSARPAPIVVMPYEPREPFPAIATASTLCSSRLSAGTDAYSASSHADEEQSGAQAEPETQLEARTSSTPDGEPSAASWLDTSVTDVGHSPEDAEAAATEAGGETKQPSPAASPTRPISRRELIVREAARRVQNNARLNALYKLQGSRNGDAPFLTVPALSRLNTTLGSAGISTDSTSGSSFLTLADSASPFHSTDHRYISLASDADTLSPGSSASPTGASWILSHSGSASQGGSSSDGLLSPSTCSSTAPTAASWLLSQAATSKRGGSSDGFLTPRTFGADEPLTPCMPRHRSYAPLSQKEAHSLREVGALEQAERARSLAIMQCVDQKTPGRKVASLGAAP